MFCRMEPDRLCDSVSVLATPGCPVGRLLIVVREGGVPPFATRAMKWSGVFHRYAGEGIERLCESFLEGNGIISFFPLAVR